MKRRGFLKFTMGAVTGAVASPMIWSTLYDTAYWTQSWSWIPRLKSGENDYIPTVSKICPGGTPIVVRTVGGRVVRTLGNPDNNISEGGLTTLAVSEGQLLYAESRVKRPLLRGPDGGFRPITWEKAEQILKEKTAAAKGSCAFIASDPTSSLNEIFSAFLKANGSTDYFFTPSEEVAAQVAWNLAGGNGRLGYDLDNSDFILSIGANLMENWGTVARNRKIFRKKNPTDGESSLYFAYAGGMQNNTAVVSDVWLPILPGSETTLVLGICRALVKQGLGQNVPHFNSIAPLVEPYTVEYLQEQCGIIPERFETMMQALLKAKRPLVITGCPLGTGGGAAPILASIVVNNILGRLGKEGNMVDLPIPQAVLPLAENYKTLLGNNLVGFAQEIASGVRKAPKLLFLCDANPLYAMPKNVRVQECLDKIEFKIAFSTFWDETSAQCDLVLPAAFGLERFDDAYTPYGSGFENWTLAKPVAEPRYEARPTAEVILALAEELRYDLGVSSVPKFLEKKGQSLGASFKEYVANGQTFQKPVPYFDAYIKERENTALVLTIMRSATNSDSKGIRLLPHIVYGVGSASTGIPPYANRIIGDYYLKGKYAVVQMNSQTAKSLNLEDDDKIILKTANGTITALVAIYNGIMDNVVSMLAGLGHTEFDRFSLNKGENILNLAYVHTEKGTGLPIWSDSEVQVVKG